MMLQNNFLKFKRGYTLLFSVLLTSLVLSLSLSILNIARKEVLLSGSARESFAASYIADGAMECAIWYDKNDPDKITLETVDPGVTTVFCGKKNRLVNVVSNGNPGILSFYISDELSSQSPCAKVEIKRYTDTKQNVIEARGYNVGYNASLGDCSTPAPQKVERAFRYYYTSN